MALEKITTLTKILELAYLIKCLWYMNNKILKKNIIPPTNIRKCLKTYLSLSTIYPSISHVKAPDSM